VFKWGLWSKRGALLKLKRWLYGDAPCTFVTPLPGIWQNPADARDRGSKAAFALSSCGNKTPSTTQNTRGVRWLDEALG
jgi:hypothetical protein